MILDSDRIRLRKHHEHASIWRPVHNIVRGADPSLFVAMDPTDDTRCWAGHTAIGDGDVDRSVRANGINR